MAVYIYAQRGTGGARNNFKGSEDGRVDPRIYAPRVTARGEALRVEVFSYMSADERIYLGT